MVLNMQFTQGRAFIENCLLYIDCKVNDLSHIFVTCDVSVINSNQKHNFRIH